MADVVCVFAALADDLVPWTAVVVSTAVHALVAVHGIAVD